MCFWYIVKDLVLTLPLGHLHHPPILLSASVARRDKVSMDVIPKLKSNFSLLKLKIENQNLT